MKKQTTLIHTLKEKNISLEEKLKALIRYIRPSKPTYLYLAIDKMAHFQEILESDETLRGSLSDSLNGWLLESKISSALLHFGILSKNGFSEEITSRLYNKFLPPPPKHADIEDLFSRLFENREDGIWIHALDSRLWQTLFETLLSSSGKYPQVYRHLLEEVLYTLEILTIWIASEEFDADFIRLDASILKHDSAFIALQREIMESTQRIRRLLSDDLPWEFDTAHIDVLIQQCNAQLLSLKKKSVNQGISISLTYKFERLDQIITRLQELLALLSDPKEFPLRLVELFKKGAQATLARHSVSGIINQNIRILARSVTNNASDHGEHYITETRSEYLKMLFSASGAGIVIAFMAWIKIGIMALGLTQFLQTVLTSLNYGIGFVLIHILGFTIATKQPAMTASTIARVIEKGSNNKANQHKLIELIVQVARSQFAAVVGNVTLALGVAFMVGYLYALGADPILTPAKAEHYLSDIHTHSALFFAAVAGFWLFVSGLISGYFDNRANYLDLERRYFHHPLLKRLTTETFRVKLSRYLHENHGAFAGNFIFGLLLGVTPFLGYIFQISLDIRHIAFSSANLGYCAASVPIGINEFFLTLGFVLMIGGVNLAVSFFLALKIALKARGAYFGGISTFAKLLFQRIFKHPKDLFFPPSEEKKRSISSD